MSEKCDFYRNGACRDVDGDEPCGYAGQWEDCYYYIPKDPFDEESEEFAPDEDGCTEATREETEGKLQVVYLPVELIDHHPDNPRRSVGDVAELAESIRAEGIQQPLTVIAHVGGEPGRYTAVIGHRRLEAAKKAGLQEVPAFVREMSRREQLRTMMTENTQREDLTPLEEADGFRQIMFELPEQTVAAVARETGFSETTVRRRMKLLELPRDLVQQAEERNVTLGDYEKLAAIKDPNRKAEVLKTAGTCEFDRAVKDALDREEKLRHRDRLVRELKSLGCREITAQEVSERGDLESQSWNYDYRWKEGERAESWLAAGYTHVFVVSDEYIRVLRVKKNASKASDAVNEKAKAQERERRRLSAVEEMDGLHAQMEQMVHDFRLSREDFVGSYDKWERNREEIMAFAVRMLLNAPCSPVNVETLADWLGIDQQKGKLDEQGLRRMLRLCPEKVLLYTAYWSCESRHRGYTEFEGTDYELNTKKVYHRTDSRADALYEGLKELGYLMSEDERKWQKGQLLQYQRAKEIAAGWKR